MNAECHHGDDANAYVADELSPREQSDFEVHLATCQQCREAVASSRRIVGLLRASPGLETTADLAPRILARLQDNAPSRRPSRWPRVAAIAAVLTLLAGGAALTHFHTPASLAMRPPVADENAVSITRALDWLCQNQEPDGSWDAEKWGGNRRFEVALTALPALALLNAESPLPPASAAVSRAAQWLQQQQHEDGSFGPDFSGAAYNQSIATIALLRTYQRSPSASLKHSLDAALANLLARQTDDGGWGYVRSPLADRSITEWHLEALALADTLGWEATRPPLLRGQSWLAVHPQPQTKAEEPADSPSATESEPSANPGKLDFYRAYFLTAALQREHDSFSRQQLADIRRTLLLRQKAGGSDSGSWPADDRWGRAGGRLYSTALASLSLEGH